MREEHGEPVGRELDMQSLHTAIHRVRFFHSKKVSRFEGFLYKGKPQILLFRFHRKESRGIPGNARKVLAKRKQKGIMLRRPCLRGGGRKGRRGGREGARKRGKRRGEGRTGKGRRTRGTLLRTRQHRARMESSSHRKIIGQRRRARGRRTNRSRQRETRGRHQRRRKGRRIPIRPRNLSGMLQTNLTGTVTVGETKDLTPTLEKKPFFHGTSRRREIGGWRG